MTIENLTRLIQSLSGAEKRQFKITSQKQGGPKDYLGLFEIIEQSNPANTEDIKARFSGQYPKSIIYNTARYLCKLLTDSLVQARMEKDNMFSIFHDIMRVKILQDRSLNDDAYDLLKQVKQRAAATQQHVMEYYIHRQELDYLSDARLFQLQDKALIETQMKAKDILKTLNHIQDHHSLFEILKYRLLHSGKVSSDEEKKRLNDLILSEMILVSGKSKNSFAAQKLHLLFQSFFFTDVGDFHSALQTFYSLNAIFENNLALLHKPPNDYLLTLTGILDNLQTIRQYEQMNFFLEKLNRLDNAEYPEYFRVQVRKSCSIYQLSIFCNEKNYEAAIDHLQNAGQQTLKLYPMVNEERQLELYFYHSLTYYRMQDLKKAHASINQAMTNHKMQAQWQVCKAIRLLNIIIHYEKGDTDYIEYEIRSYRRFFRKRHHLLDSENVLFKFFSLSSSNTKKKLPEVATLAIRKELQKIDVDKYESQLLKYFNYLEWIEARVDPQEIS